MSIHPIKNLARSRWHAIQRRAPTWAQASLMPRLFQVKELASLLFRPKLPTMKFCRADGTVRLTALAVGLKPSTFGPYADLLAEWPERCQSNDTPFWSAGNAGVRESAEVVLVEGPQTFIQCLPRRNSLILSRCVSHLLDVTGDWEAVRRRFHRSIITNELRLFRKHDYRFEKSTQPEHFAHFYEQMYLPTMRRRHGSATILASHSQELEQFEHGFLMRVFKGGTWVAGALCELRASGLRLCELGVLAGNDELMKQGAMAASYVAAIRMAHELQCGQIDLTVSASLLTNGVFQHKRKWGTSLSLPVSDQRQIWLNIARYTPATHRLLAGNPMITVNDDGQLQALVALESLAHWTGTEVARWQKHFAMPGLRSIRVLPLDQFRETGVLSLVTVDSQKPAMTTAAGHPGY